MDIYRENILDHYKNPRNFGRLKNPAASYEAGNPLCGDVIGMEIKVRSKIIDDIKFWGEGCAISQASASILTEKVKGKNLEEIKKIGKEGVLKMLGIQLSPVRLKCALLPLEVLQKAITLV